MFAHHYWNPQLNGKVYAWETPEYHCGRERVQLELLLSFPSRRLSVILVVSWQVLLTSCKNESRNITLLVYIGSFHFLKTDPY